MQASARASPGCESISGARMCVYDNDRSRAASMAMATRHVEAIGEGPDIRRCLHVRAPARSSSTSRALVNAVLRLGARPAPFRRRIIGVSNQRLGADHGFETDFRSSRRGVVRRRWRRDADLCRRRRRRYNTFQDGGHREPGGLRYSSGPVGARGTGRRPSPRVGSSWSSRRRRSRTRSRGSRSGSRRTTPASRSSRTPPAARSCARRSSTAPPPTCSRPPIGGTWTRSSRRASSLSPSRLHVQRARR